MARPAAYFAGKHVLVTGGSAGIGLAVARRLVGLGAGVTLVARRPEPLAEAAAELQRSHAGSRVRILALDIADEAAVAEAVPRELAEQPLDVLVNCAGISRAAEFLDAAPADLREHMEVNYFGAVWMCRAVVPHFLERGSGHVVNVGSTASLIGVFGYSAYTPPKFALYGFSEVLRAELRRQGVGVTVVLPSSTRTGMLEEELADAPPETRAIILSGRVLSPEQVADALVRGVAKGRFEVVPGADIRLSVRAYRLVPGIGRAVLDREARRAAHR